MFLLCFIIKKTNKQEFSNFLKDYFSISYWKVVTNRVMFLRMSRCFVPWFYFFLYLENDSLLCTNIILLCTSNLFLFLYFENDWLLGTNIILLCTSIFFFLYLENDWLFCTKIILLCISYLFFSFSILILFLWLCLVPRKYKKKKKNIKENDFLMFGCPIKYSKEN